jgi:hypothetical protein
MKRKLLNPTLLKRTALAVPAAALMLGAAQAGTTIGLNFQAWYYADGGAGYQTTGFPVTAKAFGVDLADWLSTFPQDCQSPINASTNIWSVSVSWTAPNAWQSGIGELNAGWVTEAVAPGDDEATWGYLDDGNSTGSAPTASLTGLAATFPSGYVIQTIAANSGVKTFDPVDITDGVATTNTASYSTYYVKNPESDSSVSGGTVGLSTDSGVFTSDTVQLYPHPKTASNRSVLAGFIVTDKPVVSLKPVGGSVNQGSAFTLSAGAIGIPPLSFQWRLNGSPIPNATNKTYEIASAGQADAGEYDLVVTNALGAGTSVVASVSIAAVPNIVRDLAGITGTIYAGGSFSQWGVVAVGGQPLYYGWLKDGKTSVGLNSPTLTLSNLATSDSGAYSVVVTNVYGSARSATNHLVVTASPNLYTTEVAQDSPSAYWPLNETTGTDVVDHSGGAHDGTNNIGTTLGVAGPRLPAYAGFDAGKLAYQFNGSSGYIDCGTGASLSGTNDFTVEAWINTTATTLGQVVQQRDSTGYNGEYMLVVNADGTLSFTVYGNGYQFNNLTSSKRVNDGQWHHVAAVRSAGTTGLLYIDGIVAASQTSTTVAPLDATIKTAIGADVRDSANYFNGMICDVAIYAAALSPSRIGLHAYIGAKGNAPVVLQVVPSGYLVDSKPSGTPHWGLNNGASWLASVTDTATPARTRTGAEVFTGASQIVTPASPDFSTPKGTIMFWLQANAPIPGPGNEGAILVDRRTTNGAVIVLDNAGEIFWQGQAGSQNSLATGYVPDGNWHHVAITYGQTTNDSISIYIDGVLSGFPAPITNAWTWPADQEMEIGLSHDVYWKKFNGQMDDFRLYSRVLTDTEINQVYSSNALVDSNTLVLRYNFDTTGGGQSLQWPSGPLESSPTLGPSAVWTPVPNAASPYPFLPPSPSSPAGPSMFYRVAF